jgi:hypothetical protein
MDKFLYSLLRYIDKKQSRSFMDTGKDLFIIRTKSSGSATIPTERYYCYQQPFKKNSLYNWNAQSNNGTTNFDNLSNYSIFSVSISYIRRIPSPQCAYQIRILGVIVLLHSICSMPRCC